MSENEAGPELTSRFNYLAVLDLIALVCIGVIAGRPDGLAITVSAVIVALLILLYRCMVGIKAYVARRARPRPKPAPRPRAPLPPKPPARRSSWLRDDD